MPTIAMYVQPPNPDYFRGFLSSTEPTNERQEQRNRAWGGTRSYVFHYLQSINVTCLINVMAQWLQMEIKPNQTVEPPKPQKDSLNMSELKSWLV